MNHSNSLNTALIAALLAFGAQAPTTPTPRALLERGALAEEHQRDFAGAQKLYEQSEAAAKAAGDTKTAAEANAAKERVLARQGKGQAPRQERDAAVVAQLRERALGVLFKAQSDLPSPESISRAAQQLIDLGPSTVELLEQSLTDVAPEGAKQKPPHVPNVAAKALVEMQTPEADRALIAAYDSPDPTIRKAVISAASEARFLELHLRAAQDSVSSISHLASGYLLNSSDLRATPIIEILVRARTAQALNWLAKHAPERCIAVAEDESMPRAARVGAMAHLSESKTVSAESLPQLVALVRKSPEAEPDLARSIWSVIYSVKSIPESSRAAVLAALEPEVLATVRADQDARAVWMLVTHRSPKAETALRAAIERRRSLANPTDLDDLASAALQLIDEGVERAQFERWAELALSTPSSWPPVRGSSGIHEFESHLLLHLAGLTRADQLSWWTALWPRAPEHHQVAFASAFAQVLHGQLRSGVTFELPQDAAPLLRFMLGRSIEDDEATKAMLRFERVDLLDAAARAPRSTLSSSLATCLITLGRKYPAAVLEALRGSLREIVGTEPMTDDDQGRLSWLLDVAPEADAVKLWQELWSVAPASSHAVLLDNLVERNFGPERDHLLVEFYPQIERLAPNLRNPTLLRFGNSLVEAALPILEREIKNPDANVRVAAMAAAEEFRKHREAVAEFDAWRKSVTVEQTTVADLSKLLESPNRDVVLGAVKALGILRARPALPALVKLLEQDDKELQRAVQAALEAMGGS